MSALTIRLPNSVHQKIKELAERDQISVNQFIASAAAEKMASVLTLDYLKAEAAQGDRAAFDFGFVSKDSHSDTAIAKRVNRVLRRGILLGFFGVGHKKCGEIVKRL